MGELSYFNEIASEFSLELGVCKWLDSQFWWVAIELVIFLSYILHISQRDSFNMSFGNILSIFILEAAVNGTTNILKYCNGKKFNLNLELIYLFFLRIIAQSCFEAGAIWFLSRIFGNTVCKLNVGTGVWRSLITRETSRIFLYDCPLWMGMVEANR